MRDLSIRHRRARFSLRLARLPKRDARVEPAHDESVFAAAGIIGGPLRPPLLQVTEAERQGWRAELEQAGVCRL